MKELANTFRGVIKLINFIWKLQLILPGNYTAIMKRFPNLIRACTLVVHNKQDWGGAEANYLPPCRNFWLFLAAVTALACRFTAAGALLLL